MSETPNPAPRPSDDPAQLAIALRNGAGWFYWIAALSLINSVLVTAGSDRSFIIGLGVTQVADAILGSFGTVGKIVAFAFDLVVAGLFVLLGWLANKRHGWAFGVGIAVYGLDGVLYLLVSDWLSVAFHVFVVFSLFAGLSAHKRLARIEADAAGPAPLAPPSLS